MKIFYLALIVLILNINQIKTYKNIVLKFTKEFNKDELTEQNIFEKLSENSLSVPITLGSHKREVKMNLQSDKKHVFVAIENSTNNTNIKIYDSKKSTNFSIEDDSVYYSEKEFTRGRSAKDIASFGILTNKSEPLNNVSFFFIAAEILDSKCIIKRNTGQIGLEPKNAIAMADTEIFNFFEGLSLYSHINKQSFSMLFDSKGNGELVAGSLPFEYDSYKYPIANFSKAPIISVRIGLNDIYFWSFKINKIYYGNKKPVKRNFIIKNAFLKFEDGMLEGPKVVRDIIYQEFFNKYIKEKKCTEKLINDLYYYECLKEGVDYKSMKSIYFVNDLSNNTFEMKPDDLFYEFKDKMYYLVRFESTIKEEDNWILGEPFFKKYTMGFDREYNEIYFKKTFIPHPQDEPEDVTYNKNALISIVVVFIILFVICAILFLIIYIQKKNKLKKKETSELFRKVEEEF